MAFTTNAYTFVLGDANTIQNASNGATAATITVPANSSVAFPVGTVILVMQTGAGKMQFAAAGGVTIDCPVSGGFSTGNTGCRAQFSVATLTKLITTDTWLLGGDVA